MSSNARHNIRFPFKPDKVQIELTDENLIRTDSLLQEETSWRMYSSYRRFSDGIMFAGPGVWQWLPNEELIEGKIEDVEELLRRSLLKP